MLDDAQLELFVRDGFVRLPAAVPPDQVSDCQEALWRQIEPDRHDQTTWHEDVIIVPECRGEPFTSAINTPALHEAFDLLVGHGRWVTRESIGWFVIRFPSDRIPPDAGWHVDGSYPLPEQDVYGLNVRSRNRVLLMLCLFSDVAEDDAPTRLRKGSHLAVPPLLAPAGEAGCADRDLLDQLGVTATCGEALATGRAGDVYLCHPFLVHTAQANRGRRPRVLAQPSLVPAESLNLDPRRAPLSPVERAIWLGLKGVSR